MEGEHVFLLIKDVVVGSAKLLFDMETKKPKEVIHGYCLREFAGHGQHLVAVYSVQIFEEYKDWVYPYHYKGFENPPTILGDLNVVEKAFKHVISWDMKSIIENKSSITPMLGSMPKKVSAKSMRSIIKTLPGYIPINTDDVPGDLTRLQDGFEIKNPSEKKSDEEQETGSRSDLEGFVDLNEFETSDEERDDHSLKVDVTGELEREESGPYVLGDEDNGNEIQMNREPPTTGALRRSEFDTTDRFRVSYSPSSALEIGMEIKKRPYLFKNRKKAVPKGTSKLSEKRMDLLRESLDVNPFLVPRKCCNSMCFHEADPDYTVEQYRSFLQMTRTERKRSLKSMYDSKSNQFRFNGAPVCARFLSDGLKFSFGLQSSVKGTPGARSSTSIQACPRERRSDTKKDDIILFVRGLSDAVGNINPVKGHSNLPHMSKQQVYELYLDDLLRRCISDVPAKNYFYKVWAEFCPEIRKHRYHGFTVCDICERLRAEMRTCMDEAVQAVLRAKMKEHNKVMEEERRGYAERRNLAMKNPSKYCSIIVDGADQKSYGLPHFMFNTKTERGHKLKIKCVGVLEHGREKHLSLFTLTEEFESGANHVLEAIHRVLDRKSSACGFLPEVLFIQADNCTRENKNRYFMAYCEMLVARGVFMEVQVSFLPIGHTHADIDQSFSSVATRLRMVDAITMEDLLTELRSCYNPRAFAEEMRKVANFSSLCELSGCLIRATNFSQYRYFRFTRRTIPIMPGEASELHPPRNNRYDTEEFYLTTCDVKFQSCEEWAPFDNSSNRKGFLKFVPNLAHTPSTDTTPPDNVLEINKCLRSSESRLQNVVNLLSLENMRDRVYTRRVDHFHWKLDSVFEMFGDYLNDEPNRSEEVVAESIEKLRYSLNYFLAVKTEESSSDPFWIARTLRVAKVDESGNALELKVRWFQARDGAKDAFEARYDMATVVDRGNRVPFEDIVDVRAVLCEFESLTKSGGLHVRTCKAIRQALHMN